MEEPVRASRFHPRPSSGRLGAVVVMAWLAAGCGGRVEPTADTTAMDAGPPRASPRVNDAGTDAGLMPLLSEEDRLRADIAGLRSLLSGVLPADLDPQTLFEVDLLDARACQLRADALARRLLASAPDAGLPALDAGRRTGSDGAIDGGAEGNPVLSDAGVGVDAAAPDAGRAPEVTRPGGGGAAASDAQLAALRRERDTLRLDFLQIPVEQRVQMLRSVRARRRIAAEEEASLVAQARARAEEERASIARRDALDRVALSASAIQRELLSERARIEAARGELARWQASFAERRQAEAQISADRLELAHAIRRALASGVEPEEADAYYAQLVEALSSERAALDDALDTWGAPSEVPRFEPHIDPAELDYGEFVERAQLVAALSAYETERAVVVENERDYRWAVAERAASDARRLDALRIELLPLMSRAQRETYLGLGPEGRAQFLRELTQVRLLARYWLVDTVHDAPLYPRAVGALLARSTTRNELLFLMVLMIGIYVGFRRRNDLTTWLKKQVYERSLDRRWVALVRPFWVVIGPTSVNLLLLTGLYGVFAMLVALTDAGAVSVLRIVVIDVAWYLVLESATSRYFVSRIHIGSGRAALARRVVPSVRLVLGFGLGVALSLHLSELLVGRGYLYGIVIDFAWLGALPLAVVLIRRWANEVMAAHRAKYATGFVARRLGVEDSQLRRYVLTPPAAAQMALAGLGEGFKELALRFDQSRRAFAYLFRRRLEKQADVRAREVDVEALPPAVRAAFADDHPLRDYDFFPGIDDALSQLHAWQEGETGFALAVIGERGIGKTCWMRELVTRAELDVEVRDVPRLNTPEAVCRWLGEELGLGRTTSVDELTERICDGEERRVIVLDHCQNLVVRAIGGGVGLETLVEVAARTTSHMVWVCAFARFTWMYLERARQAQDLFTRRVQLVGWPEEQIAALVRARMDAIEMRASFRDLVVDSLAGSELELAVLRTESEYLRLLWDYSQGNPRVALHFWLHSLVPHDDELRVQLFEAPDVDALDALHEQSRFLLAAVVLHENVSEDEAAITTGMNGRQCRALLAYLGGLGYLYEDEHGYWRVTTHWYRAVIRYLRRKRLLFD